MNTFSKIDPSTLGWVKGEIDETLKQARLALESFAENPTDKTRLRFCITHLHQVVGTLTMVELDAAAMLARATEQLAEAVLNDNVAVSPVLFDTLTRAMITLPDHLARVQGQSDAPFKYVPLINEIRGAHGLDPISELDLFTPDISVRPPAEARASAPLDDAEYRTLARTLRTTLQTALLNWLRDTSRRDALNQIGAVCDQMRDQAPYAPYEQLFWVAGGFVELLADGVEPIVKRKKLFARLEQQFKRLAKGAEKSELRKNAETIVRAMLWEIGSNPSSGQRATQLRQAFGLEVWMPDSAKTQMFEMPAPEVLTSVSNALGAEVTAAQDVLTTYFDPANHDPRVLKELIGQLEKMSSALDMLGVPPLKQLVDEIAAVCRALIEKRIADADSAAMPLAEALLALESGAREVSHTPHEWSRTIEEGIQRLRGLLNSGVDMPGMGGLVVGETELTESELKQLLGVVAVEVGANLVKIEEAIEAFATDSESHEQLQDVPGLLAQIQGTIEILAQDRAAALVDATRVHVENILAGSLTPTPAVMDALAVCVGTIGAFMEGLHTDRRNLDGLIDSALQGMDAALLGASDVTGSARPARDLKIDLENWLATPHDAAALADLSTTLENRAQLARARDDERSARIADEIARLLQLVEEQPARLTTDVIQMLRESVATLALKPAVASPPRRAASSVQIDNIDEEIRDIFVEDARDVLSTMGRFFAVWREDQDNAEALGELRRGFHTLKGSGRMVNASTIAEFSWAIENLLNRVRDGKISPTDEIVDVVARAQDILPQMVSHYAGGAAPTLDAEPVRLRAQVLAKPKPSEARVSASERDSVDVSAELPKLDGTLLDIFTHEARGHLESIEREISRVRAEGARLISEAMFRATHTLAGNARSLGIQMMSEACYETEKALHAIRTQGMPMDEQALELMQRLHMAVTDLVDLLNRGERSAGDLRLRFGAIADDARTMLSGVSATESHPAKAELDDMEITEEIEILPMKPASRPVIKPLSPALAPDVDPELLEIFFDEAGDILTNIDESLARLRVNADDRPALADFKRGLHTLKGGGRMAGVFAVGNLAHATEELLKRVEEGRTAFSAETFELFHEVHDVLIAMLDRLKQGEALPETDALYAKMTAMVPDLSLTAPEADDEMVVPPVAIPPTNNLWPQLVSAKTEIDVPLADATDDRRELGDEEARSAWSEKAERRGQIKVRTALLNDLVNFAGEVSISRSRMEQQIHSFRDNLGELSRNVVRFREQIRELEIQSESQILYRVEQQGADGRPEPDFDPLEFDRFSRLQQLSRSLAESLHDLSTIQNNLGTFVGEAETVLQQQARINTDLQEGLMRTRLVSFDTIAARLRHIVRTTARELGKNAELDLTGAEVEVDRTVLERMIGPFEHMIRNSLDHGLEEPEQRRRLGKPTVGTIAIACAQEGGEIVIRFSDDGSGLDIHAIRRKAIERGLLAERANLTDEDLIQFVLMPGFSTATKVTHLSGRGVGMDVVHNEVKQLGGVMSVDSRAGAGAAFIIRLPLTLSITQALMVHVGEQLFAVSLGSIANIVEFPVERLNAIAIGKNPMLEWSEQVYPYVHLGRRLGIDSQPRNSRKVPVLLVHAGSRQIAMQVDGLGGTREAVIKALGPQLAEIKGLAGATIFGDGRVVLILDLAALWYREETLQLETHRLSAAAAPKLVVHERPLIMVVDDSLTVRKVTGKHLQKRGMEVLTAKDGVDAVEQLRDRVPDVMLVDIEMPRMDGYELTQRIRSEARLKHIPIIMITSRAGAKHRQKAFELGVNLYMSKPYQEEELFKNIDMLLAGERPAG